MSQYILTDTATGLPRQPREIRDFVEPPVLNESKGVQWLPYTPPAPVPPAPQYRTQFQSLEFMDRFTDSEQLAIVSATQANAQVKLWYDKMLAASYVDLNDPRTPAGLDALVAAGLLAADRRDAILTPELVA